jgi:hypothetical protein
MKHGKLSAECALQCIDGGMKPDETTDSRRREPVPSRILGRPPHLKCLLFILLKHLHASQTKLLNRKQPCGCFGRGFQTWSCQSACAQIFEATAGSSSSKKKISFHLSIQPHELIQTESAGPCTTTSSTEKTAVQSRRPKDHACATSGSPIATEKAKNGRAGFKVTSEGAAEHRTEPSSAPTTVVPSQPL